MHEVINNEYLLERGALWKVDDGFGGSFTLPANTAWFEKPRTTPSVPRLGQHRDSVLSTYLGLGPDDIVRLERSGAFGPPKLKVEGASEEKSDVATSLD